MEGINTRIFILRRQTRGQEERAGKQYNVIALYAKMFHKHSSHGNNEQSEKERWKVATGGKRPKSSVVAFIWKSYYVGTI